MDKPKKKIIRRRSRKPRIPKSTIPNPDEDLIFAPDFLCPPDMPAGGDLGRFSWRRGRMVALLIRAYKERPGAWVEAYAATQSVTAGATATRLRELDDVELASYGVPAVEGKTPRVEAVTRSIPLPDGIPASTPVGELPEDVRYRHKVYGRLLYI